MRINSKILFSSTSVVALTLQLLTSFPVLGMDGGQGDRDGAAAAVRHSSSSHASSAAASSSDSTHSSVAAHSASVGSALSAAPADGSGAAAAAPSHKPQQPAPLSTDSSRFGGGAAAAAAASAPNVQGLAALEAELSRLAAEVRVVVKPLHRGAENPVLMMNHNEYDTILKSGDLVRLRKLEDENNDALAYLKFLEDLPANLEKLSNDLKSQSRILKKLPISSWELLMSRGYQIKSTVKTLESTAGVSTRATDAAKAESKQSGVSVAAAAAASNPAAAGGGSSASASHQGSHAAVAASATKSSGSESGSSVSGFQASGAASSTDK